MEKETGAPANRNLVERYLYTVGWSEEDRLFIGRVAEFPSLVAHGSSSEKALREIKQVVGIVLADLRKKNELIPEPFVTQSYSGRLNVRMPDYLHRQLAIEAAQQGTSLNQWLNVKLSMPITPALRPKSMQSRADNVNKKTRRVARSSKTRHEPMP